MKKVDTLEEFKNEKFLDLEESERKLAVKLGEEIVASMSGELSVTMIPMVVRKALSKIEESIPKNLLAVPNFVNEVFACIIDKTNTKGLPDFIFDPVFKYSIYVLATILFPSGEDKYKEFFNENDDATYITGKKVKSVADKIIECLGSPNVSITCTKDILSLTVKASKKMINFDEYKRERFAMKVFNRVIDQTDFRYCPDMVVDPIIKNLYAGIIPILI